MFNYGLCLKTSITLLGKYLHVFLFKKLIKLWKLIFVENVFIVDDKEIMFCWKIQFCKSLLRTFISKFNETAEMWHICMYNIWPKVFRSQSFFDNTISLILDTAYGHVQVYMIVIGLEMDLNLLLIMSDLCSLVKIVFLFVPGQMILSGWQVTSLVPDPLNFLS